VKIETGRVGERGIGGGGRAGRGMGGVYGYLTGRVEGEGPGSLPRSGLRCYSSSGKTPEKWGLRGVMVERELRPGGQSRLRGWSVGPFQAKKTGRGPCAVRQHFHSGGRQLRLIGEGVEGTSEP